MTVSPMVYNGKLRRDLKERSCSMGSEKLGGSRLSQGEHVTGSAYESEAFDPGFRLVQLANMLDDRT